MQKQFEVKPLLTIAIPTYNRSAYLRELLSILFDQIVQDQRVELIISDNASVDDTPEVVEEYQRRGLQLRCIRNQSNKGSDANFLQCFEQARGKYVWIFGDDDIIVPGGVAAVLLSLEGQDYDLVYVNSYPLKRLDKPRSIRSSEAIEFRDAARFAKRIHVNFTFISGNIVNKARLQAESASFSALVGSNLVQLAWVYAALNKFQCGLYIQEKLVGARVDNTGGYELAEVFGSRLKRITELELHSQRLQCLIIDGMLQRFWPGLVHKFGKSNGVFEGDASDSRVLTALFKDNPRYWFFVYPLLKWPGFLGAGWFLLIRVLNRVDKALGFIL
jgi:abequosyltransferase